MNHIFLGLGLIFIISINQLAWAGNEGQFLPLADSGSPFSRVHFVPKNGNQIVIAGQSETIPPGVGVISGGVIGEVKNACIEKVCGQILAPLTLYRTFVFMDDKVMKMSFSTGGHKEDETYGNEVHVDDPTLSLVGMARTDENGMIRGEVNRQMTISWANRGHTGLAAFIGPTLGAPIARTCSDTMTEISGFFLEFLTFGINDTFRQAFTVPNAYVSGTVKSDKPRGYVHVMVGIDGVPFSHTAIHYQGSPNDVSTIHTVAIGAKGAEEGYVRVSLFMSNGGQGGCATMQSGTLYLSPLQS